MKEECVCLHCLTTFFFNVFVNCLPAKWEVKQKTKQRHELYL